MLTVRHGREKTKKERENESKMGGERESEAPRPDGKISGESRGAARGGNGSAAHFSNSRMLLFFAFILV